ncbi:MAG: signal peptidase II [Deltaproteobacteria bacterium]|nr:signal peptidase II [Deltaproteobacteria bacterium]
MNSFDRVAYGGLVVDYMSVGIGPVSTVIFNVADVAITVGVLIFFSAALGRTGPTPHQPC